MATLIVRNAAVRLFSSHFMSNENGSGSSTVRLLAEQVGFR